MGLSSCWPSMDASIISKKATGSSSKSSASRRPRSHYGPSCSFTLHGPDGTRLLGFDNAHGVAAAAAISQAGRYQILGDVARHVAGQWFYLPSDPYPENAPPPWRPHSTVGVHDNLAAREDRCSPWGPPTTKRPVGLIWYLVSALTIFLGITGSITCLRTFYAILPC